MKSPACIVSTDGPFDGFTNMSRDSHLLVMAERSEAGCRVYSWDGPWISLGKQQVAERDLLDPSLVPWVRRPTGGKAVLHGHDVTVGIALPLAILGPLAGTIPVQALARSVKTVYRILARPM